MWLKFGIKRKSIIYMIKNVGAVNLNTIAKNLNRPIQGVQLKMKRLKIGNTKEQLGLFTMGSLAQVLNVDRTTIKHWVKNYNFTLSLRKKRVKPKYFILLNPVIFGIGLLTIKTELIFQR